ncbi:MAG: DUF501 domain-containing protein [Acidobacteriota bacterium]
MDDRARVTELLGREPAGAFEVVVRDEAGDPVVVRNAPFLDDGTPMPTRFYLVGASLVREVSRLEAAGGVKAAEAAIDPDEVAALHRRYETERDAAIDPDHEGPRPSGGVGGTRVGVKCLHAHVAHHLAGGDDPVGRWALDQLGRREPAEQRAPSTVPGTLRVTIDDHALVVKVDGGGTHTVPVGPATLLDGPLRGSDPPLPADLTNALGLVQDHLDDLLIEAPSIAATPAVIASGTHAEAMARVEIGADEIPIGYELHRADADEVFRTLAVEDAADRRHNPGLPDEHVESIVATCCVILGVMRRLDLRSVGIQPSQAAR